MNNKAAFYIPTFVVFMLALSLPNGLSIGVAFAANPPICLDPAGHLIWPGTQTNYIPMGSTNANTLTLSPFRSNGSTVQLNPGSLTGVNYSGLMHNDSIFGSYVSGGYSQGFISTGYRQDPNRKFHIGSASDGNFNGSTTFVPAFTVTSGGDVGINNTNPSQKLDVAGNIETSGAYVFSNSNMADSWIGYYAPLNILHIGGAGTAPNRKVGIWDNLYVPGNVGIGTTNPSQKLDVAGNVRANDVCTTAGKCLSTVGGGGVNGSGNVNALAQWTGGSTLGNSRIFDDGQGTMILGQTSLQRGLAVYAPSGVGNGGYISMSMRNGSVGQVQVGDNQMWQNLTLNPNGGSVGVGTANPQATFDVNGTTRLNGNVTSGTLAASGNISSSNTVYANQFCFNAQPASGNQCATSWALGGPAPQDTGWEKSGSIAVTKSTVNTVQIRNSSGGLILQISEE